MYCVGMLFQNVRLRLFLFKRHHSSRESLDYCIQLVKKHDYDHYLCTLLLPKGVQPAVFALRAFNVEVVQLSLMKMAGPLESRELRFQFWRNAVDSIYKEKEPPSHPVVKQLAFAIQSHKLNRVWLNRIIDSREKEVKFYTTSSLETYAEYTSSSLLYLTLQVIGITNINVDHAASHIGKAEGIVTILRGTPYHRANRQVLIPTDILARHGASQHDFIKGDLIQTVEDSVYDTASLADAHLKKAKALDIPRQAVPAFLPAVVVRQFLDRLEKLGFNIFNDKLLVRDSLLPMKLLWSSLRKQY